MDKKKFLKDFKLLDNKYYEHIYKEFFKTNELSTAIKPALRKIGYSILRIYILSLIILSCLDNLSRDIIVYKNMTREQKNELKNFKIKLYKIFNQTCKTMDVIADLLP